MKLVFLGKTNGEWFDDLARTFKKGIKYAYQLVDDNGQEWLLNASEEENGATCKVSIETSEKATLLHEQLKRRSDVWFTADKQPEMLYHVISLPYLENKQLKRKMLSNTRELPEQLMEYNIKKFKEVTNKKKLEDKLVVVVPKGDIESMVKFFYYEKIYPLLEKLKNA